MKNRLVEIFDKQERKLCLEDRITDAILRIEELECMIDCIIEEMEEEDR